MLVLGSVWDGGAHPFAPTAAQFLAILHGSGRLLWNALTATSATTAAGPCLVSHLGVIFHCELEKCGTHNASQNDGKRKSGMTECIPGSAFQPPHWSFWGTQGQDSFQGRSHPTRGGGISAGRGVGHFRPPGVRGLGWAVPEHTLPCHRRCWGPPKWPFSRGFTWAATQAGVNPPSCTPTSVY